MTAPAPPRFRHEAYLHRGDEEFLAGVVGYVCEGLAREQTVVAVEPRPRLDLLRDALARDAEQVRFVDIAELGSNPGRLIPLLSVLVAQHGGTGSGLRVVGEGVYAGRRPAEIAECAVHEALVDHAFGPGPSWQLLCPYDVDAAPPSAVEAAMRTHATVLTPGGGGPNPSYVAAGDGWDLATLTTGAGPLPPPTDVVLRGEFGRRDLPAVRRTVQQFAHSCGLPEEQVANLAQAASELAANSVQHGGGTGSLGLWREPDAVVVEFTDAGRLQDPLAGRRPPAGQEAGMGLYLVHQLCDLVQVRTGPAGTTVRVSTWT